jgi:predicted Zn-dependent protease
MRFALFLACGTLCAQIPIEKEKALGAQLAAEYRRQTGVVEAPTVNAYLNELGQRLAAHSPSTGVAYTFELTEDEQTWIHEPAAFPGGPIFVPASLVLAARDEDELAGLLAHAIAHVATRGQTGKSATMPLITMGGWSGYAPRQQGIAVPVGFLAFQRKNELESDQLAVRVLSQAGYDPHALARYIERVQPAETPQGNERAPLPGKAERLAALETTIRQLPRATYSAHPGLGAIQQEVARLIARPAKAPPRLAR